MAEHDLDINGFEDEQWTFKDKKNIEGVPERRINLILDSSSFTRGIGNIKRWYNKEYVKGRDDRIKNQKNIITLYIPSYTLHEFDYLKKGSSIISTFTRQSIRFIDELFEKDLTENSILENFTINLIIESPQEKGFPWSKCQKFQIHSPKVKEFPNFKTKFDSSLIGKKKELLRPLDPSEYNNINDIQYENSQSFQKAAENSEKYARMPSRLKYLISSCIFKKFIQKHEINDPMEEWKLVTEDPIIKIWGSSFDMDCMNVNEAELLIFQSYDVNKLYNPHHSLEDEPHHNSILQDVIDTSVYEYTSLDRPKSSKKNTLWNRTKPVQGVTEEVRSETNGEMVIKERFNAINYAPRGQGKLWKP